MLADDCVWVSVAKVEVSWIRRPSLTSLRQPLFRGWQFARICSVDSLLNQHAVAIAEEAILLRDGVAIGGEDAVDSGLLRAGEGADEHEQAGLRKMEVGKERRDDAELEAGRDEDVGRAGVGLDGTGRRRERGGLEGADDGGADGDDALPVLCGGVDGGSGFRADGIALGVEMDLVEAIDAERREGAEADVEGDAGIFYAFGRELCQNILREVEAGGGSGDGHGIASEDGLV